MKFIISSSSLSQRLLMTGRVIAAKNSMPILDCFLFEIKDNLLQIIASDHESTLKTSLELIESEKDIRFAVNAKTLQDAMKEIPEQPLEFYINEESLEVTVQYQNGQYNFIAQNAEEYPTPNILDDSASQLELPSHQLLDALGRALFATADDPLRPVMNGIFFDITTQDLTTVASNGQELTYTKITAIDSHKNGSFILPKKPANLLKNILQKENNNVSIQYTERNAFIKTENFELVCRLIEGRFPNYNSVIPKDNPNNVTVNRESLISALRRVLIFSSASSALINFQLSQGKLTISSQDTDFSMSAKESLLCEYSSSPLSIGFKGSYLLELINNIQSEEILIKLADASRAGVILPLEQKENEEVLMLLMPMMLAS